MGPFGRWVSRNGNAQACVGWPSPKGGAALGRGPLPDVPVLALSGELDLRTPTADAASVVSRFPHGHLLVVPGTGHSVLSSPSECARDGRARLAGRPAGSEAVPAGAAYLDPDRGVPDRRRTRRTTPAGPPQTLALVAQDAARGRGDVAADRAERRARRRRPPTAARSRPLTTRSRSTRYSLEPGVRAQRHGSWSSTAGLRSAFVGVITVTGPAPRPGSLTLQRDGRLQGALGGMTVGR